jgi:glycosyltransferase involved in cell wall biosynthesis
MVDGGIFTILDNCLNELNKYVENKDIEVIALVNDSKKFNYKNITFKSFPKSKKNWLFRLYYEYFYFNKLSEKINPDVWFSLHDTSPSVKCKRRFVYCHNPNLFYKPSIKESVLEIKVGIFYLFYKFLYRINIHKNTNVFVQQHWIKDSFKELFDLKNVIVTQPEFIAEEVSSAIILDDSKIHFFYPTLGRSFKNIELIGKAILLLPDYIRTKIKVHLTIQKNDTLYADYIVKKYPLKEINYLGKITKKEVFAYYNAMDCLLFPSKLETWGLPITETKGFNKPMLVADLPYAKETVGNYENVSFYKVDKPEELAKLMFEFVSKTINYTGNKYPYENEFQLTNWKAIFDHIFNQVKN